MIRSRFYVGISCGVVALLFAVASFASWRWISQMKKGTDRVELTQLGSGAPLRFDPMNHVDFVFVNVGGAFLEGHQFVALLAGIAALLGGISFYLLRQERRGI